MAYPRAEGQFILDTDASDFGIAGVLSQDQEEKERVIAYASRTLGKPERRYCVTRKELLAVVYFVKHFRHYLYGQSFIVRTDHASLKWLFRFKNPEGQLARWLEVLSTYDFRIIHRPRKLHGNADGLSRQPCRQCGRQDQPDETEDQPNPVVCLRVMKTKSQAKVTSNWIASYSLLELAEAQKGEASLQKVREWIEAKARPEFRQIAGENATTKALWAEFALLKLKDDVLYRTLDETEQLVLPQIFRNEVLQNLHDHACGGHLGVAKTYAKLRQRFYWPGSRKDVELWCIRCDKCARRKSPRPTLKAPLSQREAGEPFERIGIDILGPLPVSERGNRYILVLSDQFSKWTEAYAIPNQEATTIAEKFGEEYICRFGTPMICHSDQGRNFESRLFQELCDLLQVKKTRTSGYRPQSNAQVERFNQTLEAMLSKHVADHQKDWDRWLPYIMMAYRASPQESTKISPNMMVLGKEVRLPVDVVFRNSAEMPDVTQPTVQYTIGLREGLIQIHELARSELRKKAEYRKRHYDNHARQTGYRVGDAVWLFVPQKKMGISPKLQKFWRGPYYITGMLGDVNVRIQKSAKAMDNQIVHVDRLKSYQGMTVPPSWLKKFLAKDIKEPIVDVTETMIPKTQKTNRGRATHGDSLAGQSTKGKKKREAVRSKRSSKKI